MSSQTRDQLLLEMQQVEREMQAERRRHDIHSMQLVALQLQLQLQPHDPRQQLQRDALNVRVYVSS